MKIYHPLFTLLTFSLILLSCDNATKSEKTSPAIEADEHNHNGNAAIVLNKGQKWKVDETMILHIRAMENAIKEVSKSTEKDYSSLAIKLQGYIELLTSNCTMTGQAHDELHKWLLPYIDLVDDLSATKNESEAKVVFTKITDSFTTFNTCFQ